MNPIRVEFEHIQNPLTEEEVKKRVMGGWNLMGQVMARVGSEISTPDNPDGNVDALPCNVWVRNSFAIPADMVAQAIVSSESKDQLCMELFNVSPEELADGMEEA